MLGALVITAGAGLLAAPWALAEEPPPAPAVPESSTVVVCPVGEGSGHPIRLSYRDTGQGRAVSVTADVGPVPESCETMLLRVYRHVDSDGDGTAETAEFAGHQVVTSDGRTASPVTLSCGTYDLGFGAYVILDSEQLPARFPLDDNPYLTSPKLVGSYLSPPAGCDPPRPEPGPAPAAGAPPVTTAVTTTAPARRPARATTTTFPSVTTVAASGPSTSTELVAVVGGAPPDQPRAKGGLPFTGSSGVVMIVIGLLMLAAGLTLLRAWWLLGSE